jgi:hypothetical protein
MLGKASCESILGLYLTPFRGKLHNNCSAFLVVLLDSDLLNCLQTGHAELLIDLIFDGDTVGIPAKSSLDVMTLHSPVSGNDILDSRGEKVAIVRQTGCEGRTIEEGVRFTALGEFDLPLEGIDLSPPVEDELLLGRKIDRHGGMVCDFPEDVE